MSGRKRRRPEGHASLFALYRGERVQLRDYQQHTLDRVAKLQDAGKRRVVIGAPCGAGKTEMALGWIDEQLLVGRRVVVLTDRRPLLDQTIRRARRASFEVAVLHGKQAVPPSARLVVTTVQTLAGRAKEMPWKADAVVLDEAHVGWKSGHRYAAETAAAGGLALGLTATPIGPGPLAGWDALVWSVTQRELEQRGLLVEAVPHDRQGAVGITDADLSAIARDSSGEWAQGASERALSPFTEAIARDVARACVLAGHTPRMIVFGATRRHAAELTEAIAAVCVTRGALVVDKTADHERREIIEAFDAGEIRVLGSVAALTLGFDSPRAEVLISARPLSRSLGWWMQMVGRVLRTAEGKTGATILDYTGNWRRFETPAAMIAGSGLQELPRHAERPRRRQNWKCIARTGKGGSSCEEHNSLHRTSCARCGAGRMWVCGDCRSRDPIPAEVLECPSCGERRKGWVECSVAECGFVQHASIGSCARCGAIRPAAEDIACCEIHGAPLQAVRDDGRDDGERLVCLVDGCSFGFDPRGDLETREQLEVEQKKEARRVARAEAMRKVAEERRQRAAAAAAEQRGATEWLVAGVNRQREPGRTILVLAAGRRQRGRAARNWILAKHRDLTGGWPTRSVGELADRLEGSFSDALEAVAALRTCPEVSARVRMSDHQYATERRAGAAEAHA